MHQNVSHQLKLRLLEIDVTNGKLEALIILPLLKLDICVLFLPYVTQKSPIDFVRFISLRDLLELQLEIKYSPILCKNSSNWGQRDSRVINAHGLFTVNPVSSPDTKRGC